MLKGLMVSAGPGLKKDQVTAQSDGPEQAGLKKIPGQVGRRSVVSGLP
jgi:hypothetical protein